MIEASFTHLLVQHFNQPSLEKIFSLLALSDLRTGKLAFAKSLELVDTDIECFVRKMSEMRNAFVHNVTNVNIHIKDFLAGFDKNKRKEYKTGFLFGYKDKQNIQLRQNKDTYDVKRIIQLFSVATFDEVPKLSIWFGSLVCLRQIYSHVILAQIRVQKQDLNEQITTLLENAIVTPQLLEEDDHQED
ncbi:MAG: hypothetical protein HC832_03220 [Leptolyngbyaceae cyanobacterium RM1_405_57]|nr:hypothetical protein [Leptolyngbyaceae cyanobacterium RM1_405_57]